MKTTKCIALLLAIVMTLALFAGCSNSPANAPAPGAPAPAAPRPPPRPRGGGAPRGPEAAVCGGWPRKGPELAGTCRDKRLDF